MSMDLETSEYYPEDELGYEEGPECDELDCTSRYTVACYLPDTNREGPPDNYYCGEHAERQGFCKSCGDFWGGIESFEFGTYHGYCDNCAYELERNDESEWDDPDGFDFSYWAGDVPDIHDEQV